jgi:hypothetical protein
MRLVFDDNLELKGRIPAIRKCEFYGTYATGRSRRV